MRTAVIGGSVGGLAVALLLYEIGAGAALDLMSVATCVPGNPEPIFGLRASGA